MIIDHMNSRIEIANCYIVISESFKTLIEIRNMPQID